MGSLCDFDTDYSEITIYKQILPKVQKLPRLVGIHLEILPSQLLNMPGFWEYSSADTLDRLLWDIG